METYGRKYSLESYIHIILRRVREKFARGKISEELLGKMVTGSYRWEARVARDGVSARRITWQPAWGRWQVGKVAAGQGGAEQETAARGAGGGAAGSSQVDWRRAVPARGAGPVLLPRCAQ